MGFGQTSYISSKAFDPTFAAHGGTNKRREVKQLFLLT